MEPQITFTNYVKSQLHANIVSDLFDRSILAYDGAYKYLNGDKEKVNDFKTVLRWYYTDLSNFIFKSIETLGEDFSVFRGSNIPNADIELKEISITKIKGDLANIFEKRIPVQGEEFNYFEYLSELNFQAKSDLKSSNILAEALVMKFMASQKNIELIVIVD